MKKYIWILLACILIADFAFAQAEGFKYEQDFILLPIKGWDYINILVEGNIVVTDSVLYNEFFLDKTSLFAFVDDIVCVNLSKILANDTPDEIPSRLDDITKELANKIDSATYAFRLSMRGIKLENIRLVIR